MLDTITPQYISDLISWGAIGARTTESQVHRQLVSGLSMPIGFKNGTDGNIKIALDAIMSAKHSHCFMGITDSGIPAICQTNGNHNCHIILRGGKNNPNYYIENINETVEMLKDKNIESSIMIDCSHGNSKKDFRNQSKVLDYLVNLIIDPKFDSVSSSIIGFNLESNINEGSQKLDFENPYALQKGVSITDSCISFKETIDILSDAFNKIG